MDSEKIIAEHPLLESIHKCNINDKKSRKYLITKHFIKEMAKRPLSALILTCATLGIYPWALYRKVGRTLKNALAARKINHYHELLKLIEQLRPTLVGEDPKKDIRRLYKQILSTPVENTKQLEYKHIYSASDIYLFITAPPQDELKEACIENLIKKHPDFILVWHAIKRASRATELECIRTINRHYTELRRQHQLTEEQIRSHLKTFLDQNPSELTKLKNLAQAFERINTSLKKD